jgi:hypothetical protein
MKSLQYEQLDLSGNRLMIPSKEIASIGDKASCVVGRIFDANRISSFSHTQYCPDSIYPIDVDQPLNWSKWSGINHLESLSKQVFTNTSFLFHFEGMTMLLQDILGIGSKIKTNKMEVKHIPMLDFNFSENSTTLENVLNSGFPRGFLLKTDNSYHFYGLDLLSESHWRKWIIKLMSLKNSEELFGNQYLQMCLDRGYSALRIYGYPGTLKQKTPFVIAKT